MPERPCLIVHADHGITRLPYTPGLSVREILDASEHRVRAACGGSGACGACLVRWLAGPVNPLAMAEYLKLSPDQRAAGERLACQLRPQGEVEILLDHPAPPSQWKSLPPEDLTAAPGALPELEQHIYGVAVDLGTTHIRVALWDRKHGKRIATRHGPNPQAVFGADVLNRLDAALASPQRAREMSELARHAIVQAVRDILARDVGEVTPMLAEIGRIVLVGNTAMLALLTETGAAELMDPANWQRRVACQPSDTEAWQQQWFMPHAEILLPAPVAGFVGSDLLADLLATRLTETPTAGLLLDVGTNTEIALWDGHLLRVTSVPGGPAFEGVGIRHGMAAELGAIQHVRATPAGYQLEVLGGGEARGFCGSGLADAIAVLLQAGNLKPSGRFAVSPGLDGLALDPANPCSAITGADVDLFQRAKAATAAAMAVLLADADLAWADLERVCVCGAFGRTLDLANAQLLGLLPPIAPARIELFADASLAGCELALLSPQGGAMFDALAGEMRPFNLSLVSDFDDRFIDQLRLRPMQ
jgi:uncharacterized 2Fe-2S/4Fe-4S cluster protein (DUF4445 family)